MSLQKTVALYFARPASSVFSIRTVAAGYAIQNFPLEPLGVSFAREPLGYDANIGHAGRKHAVIVLGFSFNHLNTPLKILDRLLPEVKSLLLFILQLSLAKSSLGTTNPSL
jgi:hypothetical protein